MPEDLSIKEERLKKLLRLYDEWEELLEKLQKETDVLEKQIYRAIDEEKMKKVLGYIKDIKN